MKVPSRLGLSLSVLWLAACAPEPGSARWCEQKEEQPKSQWSMADATTFASRCLIEDLTIGSDAWCERLRDRPKGEWTADEASSYARHCVI
jgi:hypothetical protein